MEAYAFPRIGKLKVPDVTSADVLDVLTPIWTEKAETARRVRQRIGTVMKWAIAHGWRKDNPAENIAQALPKADKIKARRKALPYAEVAGCIAAVHGSGASHATKLALEFLILTAARAGEVRGAVWSEIDIAAKVWEVTAVRMKMKRPHRVSRTSPTLPLGAHLCCLQRTHVQRGPAANATERREQFAAEAEGREYESLTQRGRGCMQCARPICGSSNFVLLDPN